MSTTRLLFAACTLLAAAAFQPPTLAQSAQPAPTASSAEVDQRIEALEQQLEALRAELVALKHQRPSMAEQPAAVVNASNVAPANGAAAPGAASVLNGARLTALFDAYYTYNANQPVNRASGLRVFDARTNQFALNLLELGLVKTPDDAGRVGYNVTLGFGDAMRAVNSGDPEFLQYLKEAYASWLAPVGKGMQVDVGKFVTPHGAEVIESNANWNYSRGLLFNYAIPFYHFGVRAKYAFNDRYSVTGYLVNGWNNVIQDESTGYRNGGKTGGVSVALSATKKLSIAQNWMGGPGATPVDGSHWRNLSDTVVTYLPTPRLSLMANMDYGRAHHVKWYGVAAYARYQFNPRYSVATRYEYFNDPDGFTTGTAQHLHGITGTVERRFAQRLLSRLEYRYDTSNRSFFQRGSTGIPGTGQSTVTAGMMLVLDTGEGK